jgi:hypothetical protein
LFDNFTATAVLLSLDELSTQIYNPEESSLIGGSFKSAKLKSTRRKPGFRSVQRNEFVKFVSGKTICLFF